MSLEAVRSGIYDAEGFYNPTAVMHRIMLNETGDGLLALDNESDGNFPAEVSVALQDEFYKMKNPDRVSIIFPDYADLIRVEGSQVKPATPQEIKLFNRIWQGHNKTGLNGIPWEDLVAENGCQISLRSLFEGKPWPVAMSMTNEIRRRAEKWLEEQGLFPSKMMHLDIGTGSGATAATAAADTEGL